jgi:hypothetical protein
MADAHDVASSGRAEEHGDSAIALASSSQCDLGNYPYVQLLLQEFQRGRDAIVRDGVAKALALAGDVNEDEALVADSVDLASSVIVDAYMHALTFATRNSFSAIQSQQILLLLTDTLDLLVNLAPRPGGTPSVAPLPTVAPPTSSSSNASPTTAGSPTGRWGFGAAPQPTHPLNDVLFHFARKVNKMCSVAEMLVDERSVVIDEREEEHVDPAALAAYEAKLAKAKKGQTVEAPPKTRVKIVEEKEVFERKTIKVGPYFNPTDMALLVDFFNATVFQHWTLYHCVLTTPRAVDVEMQHVMLDDVPTFLPPLAAAVPLDEHNHAEARLAVETDAILHVRNTTNEEAADWREITAVAHSSASAIVAKNQADRHADAAAGMSLAEYEQAKRVLDGAVSAAVHKKVTAASLLKRIERAEAAAVAGIPRDAAASSPTQAALGATTSGAAKATKK